MITAAPSDANVANANDTSLDILVNRLFCLHISGLLLFTGVCSLVLKITCFNVSEQILHNIKQEYKRLQKRRHLDVCSQQADRCYPVDLQNLQAGPSPLPGKCLDVNPHRDLLNEIIQTPAVTALPWAFCLGVDTEGVLLVEFITAAAKRIRKQSFWSTGTLKCLWRASLSNTKKVKGNSFLFKKLGTTHNSCTCFVT